jgi:hypothetical protein
MALVKIAPNTNVKFFGKTVFGLTQQQETSTLLNGLLAFYKLDDLTDATGNSFTLTNNNGITFGEGKIGNAAIFNIGGGNAYLSRTSLPNENCTESTITMWFKDQGSDGEDFLMAGGQGESEFGIIQVGGDVKGFFTNSGDGFFAGGSNANDGNWHFVAMRFTPDSFKIWLDESSNSKSGEFNSINPSEYFAIGANWDGTFALWNGAVDSVGVWNRALTDQEIAELYNAGAGKEHSFS